MRHPVAPGRVAERIHPIVVSVHSEKTNKYGTVKGSTPGTACHVNPRPAVISWRPKIPLPKYGEIALLINDISKRDDFIDGIEPLACTEFASIQFLQTI